MARTKESARKLPRPYPWTSSQCAGAYTTEIVIGEAAALAAGVSEEVGVPSGYGPSAFECMLLALPFDARVQLAGALADGLDVWVGSQPTLAAARLSCKALRRVIDDGLQSLCLNVLPDTEQGPAPSLSPFPNVTSLTLSIDADWKEPGTAGSGSCGLLPGEQPAPSFECRFADRVYPPSLLLWPLQGQPLECRQRLQNLTLIGQLTSFEALCQELPAALCSKPEASESWDDSEPSGGSGSSDGYDTSDSSASSESSEGPGSSDGFDMSDSSAGAGGEGSCCLKHLNLGNVRFPVKPANLGNVSYAVMRADPRSVGYVRFPLKSADSNSVARGHAALGPLGLQELTLGVELLPGVQAHKGLRRLHLHAQRSSSWRSQMAQCVRYRGQFGMQSLIKPSAAGLRQLPLQHVSLLGRGWEEDDLVHMLRILPDAVTSVCISGPFRAGLRLGQDSSGQATRELVLGDLLADHARDAVRVLSDWPRGLPEAARLTLVEVRSISNTTVDELGDLLALLDQAEHVQCHTLGGYSADLQELILRLRTVPREVLLEVPVEGEEQSSMTLRLAVREGPAGGGNSGSRQGQRKGDGGEGSEDGAEAGGDPGRGEQEAAGGGRMQLQLPTAEGLLAQVVEVMEVLQSEVRLSGDRTDQLVVQLRAVEELWSELQAVWQSSSCAARLMPCPAEEGEEAGEGEEHEEHEAKPKARQPRRSRAPTTVMTRAPRAAAAAAAAAEPEVAAAAAAEPKAATCTGAGPASRKRVDGRTGSGGKRRREPEAAAGPGAEAAAEAVPQRGGKGGRGAEQGAVAEGPTEKGVAAGPGAEEAAALQRGGKRRRAEGQGAATEGPARKGAAVDQGSAAVAASQRGGGGRRGTKPGPAAEGRAGTGAAADGAGPSSPPVGGRRTRQRGR